MDISVSKCISLEQSEQLKTGLFTGVTFTQQYNNIPEQVLAIMAELFPDEFTEQFWLDHPNISIELEVGPAAQGTKSFWGINGWFNEDDQSNP